MKLQKMEIKLIIMISPPNFTTRIAWGFVCFPFVTPPPKYRYPVPSVSKRTAG